jgi:hypothetical protein
MAQLLDRAGPTMRYCAGFDAGRARIEFGEKGLDLRTAQLSTQEFSPSASEP